MIKSIEIINFENHENTIIDDLSEGFNLICGASNSGKTSVIRALKLVAYNIFDPASVRVGCKNCEITVTTERGKVRVVRGKEHLWEVTPIGEPMMKFEKIGRGTILPEVTKIIGMKRVSLGDNDIGVNIMDQLEGHFMLSELDGKNASGSTRAQILDEISGLAGIESLIRDVSLDNTRAAREVKTLEAENKAHQEEMHDQEMLDNISKNINHVDVRLRDFDVLSKEKEKADDFDEKFDLMQRKSKETKDQLASFPNLKLATFYLEDVQTNQVLLKLARDITSNAETLGTAIDTRKDTMSKMPDLNSATSLIDGVQRKISESKKISEILRDHSEYSDKVKDTMKREKEYVDKIKILCAERDEILSQIKVCPLSLKPISGECAKMMKGEQSEKPKPTPPSERYSRGGVECEADGSIKDSIPPPPPPNVERSTLDTTPRHSTANSILEKMRKAK